MKQKDNKQCTCNLSQRIVYKALLGIHTFIQKKNLISLLFNYLRSVQGSNSQLPTSLFKPTLVNLFITLP